MATTRLIKSIVFSRDRALRASPGWPSWMSIKSLQGAGGGRGALSCAEAFLCRGEAGEKEKESARGTMGRGKREERLPPFPSSHFPVRTF